MGYLGDPVKGFGDYQNIEYGKQARNASKAKIPNISSLRGYETQKNPYLGQTATEGEIEQSFERALDEQAEHSQDAFGNVDAYGGLGEGPLQSWHTFYHRAALANTETTLIEALAKAVKSVPDSTPMDVRRGYYNMAIELIQRKKKTDLPYIDLTRVEIQSNLGWLVNSDVPKTGGFNAMLNKAVGRVGAVLGRDTKDFFEAQKRESYGTKLKAELRQRNQLDGFGQLDNKTLMYIGLGAAAIAAYMYFKKDQTLPEVPAFKSKRRRRK